MTQTHALSSPTSLSESVTRDSPDQSVVDWDPLASNGKLLLGSLQHPTLRLRKSIELCLGEEDGQVIVEWPEAMSLFGHGGHLASAIDDFRLSVAELYDSLASEDVDSLGPAMIELRALLSRFIGPQDGA